ncbi:MAG: extracellular solute-binding protein [Armatimonadota bacterium]
MGKLVSTGIVGLDEILCGGLYAGSCTLIEGVPGAGKTTLGLHFIYHGAANEGEPGIIVTFEQFPEDIINDAAALGFDLRALEEQGRIRIRCTSPEVFPELVRGEDVGIEADVEELGAKRILVDSISHVCQVTDDPTERRRLVYSVKNAFARMGLTALLTDELETADPDRVPFEEYLVDTVVRLNYEMGRDLRRRRFVEVIKSRGRPHIAGRHSLHISSRGIQAFPRHDPPDEPEPPVEAPMERISTGVVGLDEMLGGGLIRGFSALVAGSAGVGKTTLGLQFLCKGADQGQVGLLVSLEEGPLKAVALARGFGLPMERHLEDGRLQVLHRSPSGLDPYRLLWELKQVVHESRPRRVVVDGLTDLARALHEEGLERDIVHSLVDICNRAGATSILTTEVPELFGTSYITDEAISIIVDTIILMRYLELESEIQRAISVLKARGSDHDKGIRRYEVTGGGIIVRSRFEGAEGVMGGAPRRVDITLSAYAFSEVDARVNAELLEQFAQSHRGITPVSLSLPYNPDEVQAVISSSLRERRSDLGVIPLGIYWMQDFIDSGQLMPLDDVLPPAEQEEFLAELLEPAMREGRVYAVPAIALCGVLLYREDLLEKYGFEPPMRWDQLIQQATTILEGEAQQDLYGFQFPGHTYEGLTCFFLENLWSNDGDIFAEDGTIALESDSALEALTYMRDLIFKHNITPREVITPEHGMENYKDFAAGRTIFLRLLPNVMQNVNEPDCPVRGRVGIAPPPMGPRGHVSRTILGGWLHAVPRSARAPEAAKRFIRFMTSPAAQKRKAINGGPLPTRKSLYSDPDILARNPYYPTLLGLLHNGKHRHEMPHYPEISRILQRHVHTVLAGRAEPEEALAAASRDVQAIMSKSLS